MRSFVFQMHTRLKDLTPMEEDSLVAQLYSAVSLLRRMRSFLDGRNLHTIINHTASSR